MCSQLWLHTFFCYFTVIILSTVNNNNHENLLLQNNCLTYFWRQNKQTNFRTYKFYLFTFIRNDINLKNFKFIILMVNHDYSVFTFTYLIINNSDDFECNRILTDLKLLLYYYIFGRHIKFKYLQTFQ